MSVAGYLIVGGRLQAVDESAADLFGDLLPATDPAVDAIRKAEALTKIDVDVDSVYAAVVGNRGIEYTAAEADATAYANAGFSGPVPQSVAVYADAAGLTGQASAESILAQAAAWRSAVMTIRAARLNAKAAVRSGDIDEAMAAWAVMIAAIRTGLGV